MSNEITIGVTGMTCGGCENAVKRILSMIEGVASVSASHREKRVTVSYDTEKTDRTALERAITSAGYHVVA